MRFTNQGCSGAADSCPREAARETAKVTGHLLADLGITKTLSRPYTSNDNPYSESQFRTMKYRPEFPDRFGSIQDARHPDRFVRIAPQAPALPTAAWITPPENSEKLAA